MQHCYPTPSFSRKKFIEDSKANLRVDMRALKDLMYYLFSFILPMAVYTDDGL